MERGVTLPASEAGERALWVLGEITVVRARCDTFTLLERTAPPGGGLPPHVHRDQDEAIYILEGQYTLVIANEESRLSAGSVAFVRSGTVHALSVAGATNARCLAILTPPGPLERFLGDIGIPVAAVSAAMVPPEGAPSMEQVVASARRHGIALLNTRV